MDEPERPEWQSRVKWAECREPYKSSLDALASQWVDGSLSGEEVALELWQLRLKFLDQVQMDRDQRGWRSRLKLDDVSQDVDILAACLCDPPIRAEEPGTPQEREDCLRITADITRGRPIDPEIYI